MSGNEKRRVLLKLSGEVLRAGDYKSVIDAEFTIRLASEIKYAVDSDVQVALVIGGGNIFRGAIGEGLGMDRIKGDHMGMLATVINALALESALIRIGQPAEVQSALATSALVAPFSQPKADRALKEGRVVLLAGGTGHPYFTTDTASALRAVELGCDALLKATKVDGVYSDDPVTNPEAERFSELSFKEVIERRLRVMDQTAFSLCRENDLPIVVFDMTVEGNIPRAARGEAVGTVVS